MLNTVKTLSGMLNTISLNDAMDRWEGDLDMNWLFIVSCIIYYIDDVLL